MSYTLAGYGCLMVPMTPIMAEMPRSRANWICASCSSLGATDMTLVSKGSRYPAKLATPQPMSRATRTCLPQGQVGNAL